MGMALLDVANLFQGVAFYGCNYHYRFGVHALDVPGLHPAQRAFYLDRLNDRSGSLWRYRVLLPR